MGGVWRAKLAARLKRPALETARPELVEGRMVPFGCAPGRLSAHHERFSAAPLLAVAAAWVALGALAIGTVRAAVLEPGAAAQANGRAAAVAVDVGITDYGFTPANLSVRSGDTVTWTNLGSSQHTATSETGLWDSGPLSGSGMYLYSYHGYGSLTSSFQFTFSTPGTYRYLCTIHPQLRGTVTVEGGSAVPPTSTPQPTLTVAPTSTRPPQPTASSAADTRVVILDFEFRPAAVTVRVGDTITWFNQGPTVHTATHTPSSGRPLFDTDLLFTGQSSTIAFPSVGTFPYFCAVHPFMLGTVTVTGAAATATPTLGPTALPTPRVTATQAPVSGVGGRELTLRAGRGGLVTLAWAGGTLQTGYVLLRIGGAGVVPAPLAAPATRYEDVAGGAEGFSCYLLVPLQGDRPLGISDLLCAIRRIASGSGPGELAVRFETPQAARLTWTLAQGADGYVVVSLPQGGSSPVGGGVTTAAYPVSGTTCFLVVASQRGAAIGTSEGVCAVPGVGTLQ